MKPWERLRLLAVLCTASFVFICFFSGMVSELNGSYVFFAFVNAFLYSHFILAYWGSRHRIRSLLYSSRGRLWLGGLGLMALIVTQILNPEFSFIVFGVHFALSEFYAAKSFGGEISEKLEPSHLAFLLSGYFFATSHTLEYLLSLPAPAAGALLALTGAAFATSFAALMWRRWSAGEWMGSLPDAALAVFFFISHAVRLHWTALALIHITFWFLLPIFGNPRRPMNRMTHHFLPTLIVILVSLWLYPAHPTGLNGPIGYFLTSEAFNPELVAASHTSMRWGAFHILLTFALSRLNPQWILRRQPAY